MLSTPPYQAESVTSLWSSGSPLFQLSRNNMIRWSLVAATAVILVSS